MFTSQLTAEQHQGRTIGRDIGRPEAAARALTLPEAAERLRAAGQAMASTLLLALRHQVDVRDLPNRLRLHLADWDSARIDFDALAELEARR